MRWILAVCALAVLAGMVATVAMPAQTIIPDEATLKLFPAETRGVATIDVAGLRTAPLIQELLRQGYPGDLREFIEKTGFQPDRDVDKVTVATAAGRGVAIVFARYDRFKFEQLLQEEGKQPTETYLGRVLYGEEQVSATFIDNMIIAGNTDMVKQVIDRLAAPAPNAASNADLLAMIRKIEAGNQIWAVGQLDPAMFAQIPVQVPPQIAELVRTFTAGSYQMRIGLDVHAKAIGQFTNEDSARVAADLARGLVAMVRLQSAKQPDLLQLVNGVRIDNAGPSMTIEFDAPGDFLKKLQPGRIAQLVP
jgi:hypothetical protein